MGAAKAKDFGTGATEVKPSVNRAVARAKKAAEKKEKKEAAKEVSASARNAGRETEKAPAKKTTKVILEYQGESTSYHAIVSRARQIWKEIFHGKPADLVSLELYIKPEDQRVYYVMNGVNAGSFSLKEVQ